MITPTHLIHVLDLFIITRQKQSCVTVTRAREERL